MPFQSKHFDAFWHFLSFKVSMYVYTPYYGYNRFDWLMLIMPHHKMARGHLVFAFPSFRHSIASTFAFLTPPTSLHGFELNLVHMLYHKSRSACREIIHIRKILAEIWSLTLRIFTHFRLSSQLLHPCILDFNETWQGCCTTSLEVHVWR